MDEPMILALCEQRMKESGAAATILLVKPWACKQPRTRFEKNKGPLGEVVKSNLTAKRSDVIFMCGPLANYLKKKGVKVNAQAHNS